MSIVSRVQRHTQLSLRAREHRDGDTPPFLIVFINSICNLTCEHCFYWKELNQRNDLSFADFEQLTSDLGQFDTLNLSGGEPFIRADFGEICGLFITKNGVKQIYVPTNGYFTAKCEKSLRKVLAHKSLDRFVCEISLDGMPEYHNRFRGNPKSFEKAMETYAMLVKLQDEDPRLRIHVNTVAMSENIGEIWRLTEYIHENCPRVEHQNLAVIRGDRKNPSLTGPALEQYKRLYAHIREVWKDREDQRFGSVVEPMLQHVKVKTMERASSTCHARPACCRASSTPTATSPSARRMRRSATFAKSASSRSGIRPRPKRCAPRSRPGNAIARTKCSCGRASSFSRYN